MVKILLALLILGASQALGAYPHDNVVAVNVPRLDDPTMANGGCATLLGISPDGTHGLLISVKHVYEEADTKRITLHFPTEDKRRQARLLGVDSAYDLAALDITDPPQLKLPAIVTGAKEDGPFEIVGYPYNSNGEMRWVTGGFLGYPKRPSESAYAPSMLHTTNPALSGYSGGARFNKYGEYVGPVSGMCGVDVEHMDECWGASGVALKNFVGKYIKSVK